MGMSAHYDPLADSDQSGRWVLFGLVAAVVLHLALGPLSGLFSVSRGEEVVEDRKSVV